MNSANHLAAWTDRLAERPELFPHTLDLVNDRLLLAELSAAELSAASFLDQRIMQATTRASWVPWQPVAEIIGRAPDVSPAGFIFHVGHCGSTLLSRLLEFADGTQCLREPLPLRALAQDLADAGDGRSFLGRAELLERLRVLTRMWRRGADHTVIKATSICTDLLEPIHAMAPGTRSVFIYNRLETHVATLLAGQNALTDLRGFAKLRLQRLQHRTGLDLQLSGLGVAQLAALSWLSETVSLTAVPASTAAQTALFNFESLLERPADTLSAVSAHLQIAAPAETVTKAVNSQVLQTYSKAPEHRYDAGTRAAILADSRSRFATEIAASLKWVEELAGRSELIASAFHRFS